MLILSSLAQASDFDPEGKPTQEFWDHLEYSAHVIQAPPYSSGETKPIRAQKNRIQSQNNRILELENDRQSDQEAIAREIQDRRELESPIFKH